MFHPLTFATLDKYSSTYLYLLYFIHLYQWIESINYCTIFIAEPKHIFYTKLVRFYLFVIYFFWMSASCAIKFHCFPRISPSASRRLLPIEKSLHSYRLGLISFLSRYCCPWGSSSSFLLLALLLIIIGIYQFLFRSRARAFLSSLRFQCDN